MRKSSAGWRKLASLSLVSGLLFACPGAAADDAKATLSSQVALAPQRLTLANGLTVLLAPDDAAPRVTLRITFDLGAKDDPHDMRGMAKVIEGALRDPSTRHVQREMRDALFLALGLQGFQTDVYAGLDHTSVTVTMPASDVNVALWLESDRMGFLLDGVDDALIGANAKGIVPSGWDAEPTFRLGRAALFGPDHPYGGALDPSKITAQSVRAHIRKYLVPRNTVVALAGAFDPKVVKAQLDDGFGTIADAPKPAGPDAPKVALTSEKRVRGAAFLRGPRVGMLWATPAFLSAEDAAFDVLAGILEARLADKHVAGSKVAASGSAQQSSMKLGSVFATQLTAAPGHTAEEMERLLEAEIEALRTEGPSASEAKRASRSWMLTRAMTFTRTSDQAYVMTAGLLVKDDPSYFPTYFAAYEGLTADKIKSAAQRYLGKSQRVVVTIAPDPRAPPYGRVIREGGGT